MRLLQRSMRLETRATVLAAGPHSQLLAHALLRIHVPIVPVLGTMLQLDQATHAASRPASLSAPSSPRALSSPRQAAAPRAASSQMSHVILSYESTLFFEAEAAHMAALALSKYRRPRPRAAHAERLPMHHLELLRCPPGVTHALHPDPSGAGQAPRRTRHLYGKRAQDSSLW